MDVSRRGFLKLSGATLAASGLGISLSPAKANAQALKTLYTKESLTVCPYCSVGCGIIVSVRDGKVINTEGDPDNPINQGSLCPKGGSIYQMANKSRDKSFKARNAKGELVNRTEGIASVGSAAMDNEECWLYQKFLRGLGLVYIEHQARI